MNSEPQSRDRQPRTVVLDLEDVRQADFLGIGVNVIPTNLMDASRAHGYTDAHWEVDRRRILALRPKVARVWFQVDWIEREKGIYDWGLPEFAVFCAYLDAFDEAGTLVELNLGWKAATSIHDWFCIEGLDPAISAPRDLEAFASTASALLRELIERRGYDNLRFLTFYNEPNGWWDFDTPGEPLDYYGRMVRAVHERLRSDGLRHLVEFWGPEESGAPEWTVGMAERFGDCVDMYSFHLYGVPYDELPAQIHARTDVVGATPVGLTEFGWGRDETSAWESGFAGTVIAAANAGLRTCLVWQMNGAYVTDPPIDTNGDFTMWDSLVYGLDVKHAYLEAGALMRGLPPGAVLTTTTTDDSLRACGLRGHDGALTVLVEDRGDEGRPIRIDLGTDTVEKVWVVRCDRSLTADATAALPAVRRTLPVRDGVAVDDSPGDGYGFLLYSSAPPAPQVVLATPDVVVEVGSTTELSARVIDGDGDVVWSVIGDGGLVDDRGRFTADPHAAGQVVAVEARSEAHPKATAAALVRVRAQAYPNDVPAPILSPRTGIYRDQQTLSASDTSSEAIVRYTVDLSEPDAESRVLDRLTLVPGDSVHVKAAAFTTDGRRSLNVEAIIRVLREPIA